MRPVRTKLNPRALCASFTEESQLYSTLYERLTFERERVLLNRTASLPGALRFSCPLACTVALTKKRVLRLTGICAREQ
eukprot:6209294-Pleurochrysis_carterae.AAC.1